MYRLNLRDGNSPFHFGPPTWLSPYDPPSVIPSDTVRRLVEGADIALLIHGYNVDEALPAYSMVSAEIGPKYPIIFGTTWPGSIKIGYWFAENRADEAGKILAKVFADLPYRSLDVQGHSCGCRVALEAVRNGLRVRNLILAAAAVDNESVQVDKKYGPYIQTNCEKVLVTYSKNDKVLKSAFRMSSWFKRAVRLRFWGDDCKALGYTGPQNPEKCPFNLQAIELSSITRHGNYKDNKDYFAAWAALMNE